MNSNAFQDIAFGGPLFISSTKIGFVAHCKKLVTHARLIIRCSDDVSPSKGLTYIIRIPIVLCLGK